MNILEIKNLVKVFGGLKAVNNITFNVKKGEILGLIGPNGSGKTTIFNCINNFFPITSGDILFKGKSIKGLKTNKICRLGIGRTFQIVKPLSKMTVLENVMASSFCHMQSIKEARSHAIETLIFCDLITQKDKLAKSLPIGGRKRLEIARSLATKPELLLLDETAAGLNPTELNKAVDLINKIRDRGISILIVEHIMKIIMNISDRICAINFGKMITQAAPNEVANHPEVIKAYLGGQNASG